LRFDLTRSLRRVKPHKFTGAMARRADRDLTFIPSTPVVGPGMLLDTTVYLDVLQGRIPPAAKGMMALRTLHHVSTCVAELVHAFGRLDPAHPLTSPTLSAIGKAVDAIPAHRLDTPSEGVVAEAGILAGLVFRLGGFAPEQELAALNDAIVFLHALDKGLMVLTRNIRDFDLMDQVMGRGHVLFYRQA
jgi:hypothetical protein